MKFDFDEHKAQANAQKHDVTFAEAIEAFDDANGVESYDELNSGGEIRYRLIALSSLRLLFVAFTVRDDQGEEIIRLISARKASAKEKEFYNYVNR